MAVSPSPSPPQSPPLSPESAEPALHPLGSKWTLWAHLPHDTDWSVDSYKRIMTFDTVEDLVALYGAIPETMVRNCMLFLMREDVRPTWEDARNRDGGCFSFKVGNKTVPSVWTRLSYALAGETLSPDQPLMDSVTGVTISPKKNFCVVKVWLSGCGYKDPTALVEIPGLSTTGCIFKRHLPGH
jgi:hypothetical protein